jgi:hypothetical protein
MAWGLDSGTHLSFLPLRLIVIKVSAIICLCRPWLTFPQFHFGFEKAATVRAAPLGVLPVTLTQLVVSLDLHSRLDCVTSKVTAL